MKYNNLLSIAFIFTLFSFMPTHVFAESGQKITITKRLSQNANIVPGRLLFKLKDTKTLPSGQTLSLQKVSRVSTRNQLPAFTRKFSIKSIKSDSSTISLSQSTGKSIAAASVNVNSSRDYVLDLNNSRDLSNALEACKKDPAIEYCQPSYIYSSFSFPTDETPNDPLYKQSVNKSQFDRMQFVNEAWLKSMGEGVKIAVLDSAFLADHEDLQDNIWLNPGEFPASVDANADGRITLQELIASGLGDTDGQDGIQLKDLYGSVFEDKVDNDGNGFVDDMMGWNFYSEEAENGINNIYRKFSGHGTSVTSVVGSVGNNNKGSIGGASKAQIMLVQVGSDTSGETDGNGRGSDIEAKGIRYAVDNGAKVINYSRGARALEDNKLKEAIQYALNHGVVFVAAAGNGDDKGVPLDVSNIVPASFGEVIAVGSLKNNETKSSTSNFGTKIGAWAIGQGVAIAGSFSINSYDTGGQTSHAAPWVTGAVAMLLSKNMKDVPDANSPRRIQASEVKDLLKKTCRLNDKSDDHGNPICVLDALNLVSVEAPILTAISNKETHVGELVEFSVTASDANDNLSAITIDGETPAGATLISTETPTRKIFRWTPGVDVADGEYNVAFKAMDATGLKDIKTVKITVAPLQPTGTPALKVKSVTLLPRNQSRSVNVDNDPLRLNMTIVNEGNAVSPQTVMEVCSNRVVGIYTSQDPEVINGTKWVGADKRIKECTSTTVQPLAPQEAFTWSNTGGWSVYSSPWGRTTNYINIKLDVLGSIQRSTTPPTPVPQPQYAFMYQTISNSQAGGVQVTEPRRIGIIRPTTTSPTIDPTKRVENDRTLVPEPVETPAQPLSRPNPTTPASLARP